MNFPSALPNVLQPSGDLVVVVMGTITALEGLPRRASSTTVYLGLIEAGTKRSDLVLTSTFWLSFAGP